MPTQLSSEYTLALPARVGDVAQTALSRNEIRFSAQESLRKSQAYMAELQVASAARTGNVNDFVRKPKGTRGRMLGAGHLFGARAFVQAKVGTSLMREDAHGEEEDDEDEDNEDVFQRSSGREQSNPRVVDLSLDAGGEEPHLMRGCQYVPPFVDERMLGVRAHASWETGRNRERRWHECFVAQVQLHEGADRRHDNRIRLFYPQDGFEEWMRICELPDNGICFRKQNLPNPRVSSEEITRALNIMGC